MVRVKKNHAVILKRIWYKQYQDARKSIMEIPAITKRGTLEWVLTEMFA